MAKMNMKQVFAMKARQAAEAEAKAQAEKAARRRGYFINRARMAKAATQAA